MKFDTNQPTYQRFREILKQRTTPVVVWVGAGMSRSADLPSWQGLFDALCGAAEEKKHSLDTSAAKVLDAHLTLARNEESLWLAFDHLKRALGETSYSTAVRSAFTNLSRASIPQAYLGLWQLGINGFFSLNLDRLAGRAFAAAFSGKTLIEFAGHECASRTDILRSGREFVLNLHGTIEDSTSWVLTQHDFERLSQLPAYRTLVHACFAARTVLFCGITADDQAAAGHLEVLKKGGINLGGHFWLTDRKDQATDHWAEKYGINRICYSATPDYEAETMEFIADLRHYIPRDEEPLPIEPSVAKERGVQIPSPEELERMPANDIRVLLNKEAKRLLASNSPTKIDDYTHFWAQYSEPVYRAWSISTQEGKNQFFDYRIMSSLAKGAFGQVYKAHSPNGDDVAIKVLHGNVREEVGMLQSFRRGVASMRILSGRQVRGMVPYLAAWEIPTSTVMELIHGPNLEEAVDGRMLEDWETRLRVGFDLASIIRNAHAVPERVLHRDIRPANIMLKNYYTCPDNWELVVLDFDLSWHRDASEGSINLSRSMNGYLAPEQIDSSRKKHTRNALVDSYGVAMTLYFLASGQHPGVGSHRYKDWQDILQKKIVSQKCPQWRSLTNRFARLINCASKDTQAERWDMTRICGELGRLREAIKGPAIITSAELFAEEIVARSAALGDTYEWNSDRLKAHAEMRSGFTIDIVGDETQSAVRLTIEWLQTGDRDFENVRKYISTAADNSCAQLRKGTWRIDHKRITASTCHIEATTFVASLRKGTALDAASSALGEALECLRLM